MASGPDVLTTSKEEQKERCVWAAISIQFYSTVSCELAAMASKRTWHEEAPKPKKQRQTKVMPKKVCKTLQDSLKSLDASVLVSEAVMCLNQEFMNSPLMCFIEELCKEKQLLQELVDNHCQIFVTLHYECKKEKNLQMRFQLRWLEYCSAFISVGRKIHFGSYLFGIDPGINKCQA